MLSTILAKSARDAIAAMARDMRSEAMRAELPKPSDVGVRFERLAELDTRCAARVEERRKQKNDAARKRIEADRLRGEANLGEIDIAHPPAARPGFGSPLDSLRSRIVFPPVTLETGNSAQGSLLVIGDRRHMVQAW